MIRPATRQDIPAMLAHAQAMHVESRYRVLPWDGDKVAGLIDWLIESPDGLALVAEDGGEVVGGMLAVIEPHFFSTATIAQEYGVFVAADRRGSLAGLALYHRYVAWAQEKGAALIQAGASTGVNHPRACALLRSLGFASVGHLFELEEKPRND